MAEEPPKDNHPLRKKLLHFTQSTTIHSVSRQTLQNSLKRRLLWGILFISSLSYAIYQCRDSVRKYLRDPISINNTWKVFTDLEFPAVTICNLNPLRKKKINNATFVSQIHEDYTKRMNSSFVDPAGYKTNVYKMLQAFVASQNDSTLKDLGHQENTLILECLWKNKPCDNSLEYVYSPTYGNCFTFNSNENDRPAAYASRETSHEEQTLQLLLNIESDEYVGALSPNVGAVVVVHDRNIMPFPSEEGLIFSPGFSNNVAITKEISIRVNRPTSVREGCNDSYNMMFYANKSYSVNACLKNCLTLAVLDRCNCVPSWIRHHNNCDPFNATQNRCIEQVDQYLDKHLDTRCNCLQPCEENFFLLSTSTAVWPSKANWQYLKVSLENSTARQYASKLSDARENLIRLNVFYSNFRVKIEQQYSAFNFGSLIGAVGGQFGLCVGMSILSLCEVLEFLYDLCVIIIRRKNVTPTSPSTT